MPRDDAWLKRERRLVLLLALAVRFLALYFDSLLPMFRDVWLDSQIYDDAGKIIAAGDWGVGHEVLHMSPAYSYFVGLIYSFAGSGPWSIRIAQLLLGLITVGCVHSAASLLFGRRWGLFAGITAALYGPFIFYDLQLLADGLATVLSAAFLLLLLNARRAGASALFSWAQLGLVWGLAMITRPNTALLLVPVLVALRLCEGRRGPALVVTLVSAGLMVLPVTARNFFLAHESVLITDTGGMNFYIGNGPDSIGTFHAPPGLPEADRPRAQFVAYRQIAEKAVGHVLSAHGVDAYWRTKTWRYIAAHPGAWLRVMGEKAWLFWNAREISNTEDYTFVRTLNPLLGLPLPQFGWLAPLALLGTILMFARRRPDEVAVATVNLVLFAANVVVFILARYRVSAVPGLLVAGVGALQWLVSAAKERRWRPIALAALALAPLEILTWTPKLPASPDKQYLKLGNSWFHQNVLSEAQRAYGEAVAHNPENISAQKNLAIVLDLRGDREGSRAHWQEVARIAARTQRPDYAQEAATHLGPPPP